MKIKKKYIIITLIIIISGTWWYFWNQNKKEKQEAEKLAKMNYTVKKWDIKNEVKVTSTTQLADEQNLSFWQAGKIKKVYVNVWDEVKAGQILAELNMDDYENTINTAKLELDNARLSLTKLLNNDTSLRESQLNSQIKQTKANYEVEIEQENVLKKQLETLLAQKNNNLEQLVRDYKLAKKNLEINEEWLNLNTNIETKQTETVINTRKQTIDSVINWLNTSLWDIEIIIESIDKIFWVSTEFRNINNDYEIYLWAKDSGLKLETENNITNSYNILSKYKNIFNNTDFLSISDEEIYSIIENYYNDTKILITLCDSAIDSLDKSIESYWYLTSTMIDWFKTIVTSSRTSSISLRSKIETYLGSINSISLNTDEEEKLNISLDQKNLDYEKQEENLKKLWEQILTLKNEIENQEIDNKNQLNRKKAQNQAILQNIEVLKKELKDLLDWADEYDINQQRNLVSQAELRIEKVKDQKDDYQIIADFDWRVRNIDIVEWEQYKLDDRKYIVVENPNLIELELQVSQIDIVKINEKDPVVITFDAYPNTPIKSYINSRNVNPEPNWRWWYYYKANVLIEKQDLEILAWMTALVTITTDSADDIILIPSLSLLQEWEKKFVYKKQAWKYIKQEIKTWIINNFQAEVIEWLNVWDIIKSSVLDEDTFENMWIDETSSSIF